MASGASVPVAGSNSPKALARLRIACSMSVFQADKYQPKKSASRRLRIPWASNQVPYSRSSNWVWSSPPGKAGSRCAMEAKSAPCCNESSSPASSFINRA